MGFSGQFPAKQAPVNLTPKLYLIRESFLIPEPGDFDLYHETVSNSAFPGTKKILQRYLEVCVWGAPEVLATHGRRTISEEGS